MHPKFCEHVYSFKPSVQLRFSRISLYFLPFVIMPIFPYFFVLLIGSNAMRPRIVSIYTYEP